MVASCPVCGSRPGVFARGTSGELVCRECANAAIVRIASVPPPLTRWERFLSYAWWSVPCGIATGASAASMWQGRALVAVLFAVAAVVFAYLGPRVVVER